MSETCVVTIENNDCKIWNRDTVVLDLVDAIQNYKEFTISLNSEGPCAQALGLYTLLDNLCSRYSYDPSKITIRTCNLVERHSRYKIYHVAPIKHIKQLQTLSRENQSRDKHIKSTIKHFGHFIGHSSRARLIIASWLKKNHYDKTLQTFHSTCTHDLHREFIGLEDAWFHGYDITMIKSAVDFLSQAPLLYDQTNSDKILHWKMYGILPAYNEIFVDIVCNTFVTGHTFYMDEKLWRPIITKTPFIVHGPQNFIINLRKLGFKTFDRWWGEGFSEDSNECQVRAILKIIDQLSELSHKDLVDMYHDMKPVLDHNLEVFMSLESNHFLDKEYL
jgi:hypothetical protein